MFVDCSYNVNKMFTMFIDFMTENDKKSSPIWTGFSLTKRKFLSGQKTNDKWLCFIREFV